MRDVAQIGLLAVGASFLPLAIHAYGASPDVTWRIGSAAFVAVWGLGLGLAIRSRQQRDPDEFRNEPIRNAVNATLNVVGVGLLLFNVFLGDRRLARATPLLFCSFSRSPVYSSWPPPSTPHRIRPPSNKALQLTG